MLQWLVLIALNILFAYLTCVVAQKRHR